eukprot:jgi/Botrbrau1/12480/Bobra.0169s0027.1
MSRHCLSASQSPTMLTTESCSSLRHISCCQVLRANSRKARRRIVGYAKRLDIQAVIPQTQGDATEQSPPDLPSYLFKERIVYLGMSLVPAVTELMLAEMLYLQYDNPTRPIYMYINSAGVQKGGDKLGYESEAFAIYDTMRYIKPPIHTLCVGTAFGEAAFLLSAGVQGKRGALPSTSIMLRQPMNRFGQMQATDIDIYRKEVRKTKEMLVDLMAKHMNKDAATISRDIERPKYFNPYEAVEYGIIDRVLEPVDSNLERVVKAASESRGY